MLLDADGFDHYGGVIGNQINGILAAYSNASLSTFARTGTHSLRTQGVANGPGSYRRVVPQGAQTTLGLSFGFYMPNLPGVSGSYGIRFQDINAATIASFSIATTGHVQAYRGAANGGTLLGTSSAPALVSNAWNFVEYRCSVSSTIGSMYMHVNGVLVPGLNLDNVNTNGTGLTIAQYDLGSSGSVGFNIAPIDQYIDDLRVWNASGSDNNDFAGDYACYWRPPTSDHATIHDFVPNTGTTTYTQIDEADPNAADYARALLSGDKWAGGFDDLPADVTDVAGIISYVFGKKLNSGPCTARIGINSGGSFGYGGADIPMTTTDTFWRSIIERDPATGLRFDPSAINAAYMEIDRTA